MYHYIRNNEQFDYNCFSRRKAEFINQVDHFYKNSKIVNPRDIEEIKYYLKNNYENAFLLTFDDGYKDHLYCAEYLFTKGLSGIFFPPINILKKELLDVNAIHYLIGQKDVNLKLILDFIIDKIKLYNFEVCLNSKKITIEKYLKQIFVDRYGSKIELIFIKQLLQRDIIGISNRKKIIQEAIYYFTSKDPKIFTESLYLSLDDMLSMKKKGMFFGSHGLTHQWLDRLPYSEQFFEVSQSFTELTKMKLIDKNSYKFFCYPYGSYNHLTLKILEDLDINFGFTTKVGGALKSKNNNFLELKRWNTNDCWDKIWNQPILPYY